MKSFSHKRNSLFAPSEQKSEQLLLDKMGLSIQEFRDISDTYGVNASQLLEIMQLSKYEFVFNDKIHGQCYPCYHLGRRRMSYP